MNTVIMIHRTIAFGFLALFIGGLPLSSPVSILDWNVMETNHWKLGVLFRIAVSHHEKRIKKSPIKDILWIKLK